MTDKLFDSTDLSSFLESRVRHIREHIQSGDLDDDIREDPEHIAETLSDEHKLNRISISQVNMKQNHVCKGSTLSVSFYTTFEGDPCLLEYRPKKSKTELVLGTVSENRIAMEIVGDLGDDFKRMLERWRESLEYHTNSANEEADYFNNLLPTQITKMVKERHEQIRMMDDTIRLMGLS